MAAAARKGGQAPRYLPCAPVIHFAGAHFPIRSFIIIQSFDSNQPSSLVKPTHSSIEPLEARIAPAFAAVLELSALTGANGFTINGVAADDYSGFSVSGAGDINGDGIDDLIIGAYGADPNGDRSGASYVVFGSGAPFAASLGTLDLEWHQRLQDQRRRGG